MGLERKGVVPFVLRRPGPKPPVASIALLQDVYDPQLLLESFAVNQIVAAWYPGSWLMHGQATPEKSDNLSGIPELRVLS